MIDRTNSNSEPQCYFSCDARGSRLPDDLIVCIFKRLGRETLFSLGATSSYMRELGHRAIVQQMNCTGLSSAVTAYFRYTIPFFSFFSDVGRNPLKHAENVVCLDLMGIRIFDEATKKCVPLCDQTAKKVGQFFPNVWSLNIRYAAITPIGLQSLAHLKLTELDVSWSGIGDEGAEVIGRCFPSLHVLDISCTRVTPIGLESLSHLPLKEFAVLGNRYIGDQGAKVIGQRFLSLRYLDMTQTNLTINGLQLLSDLPLTVLNVSWNKLDDEGVRMIGQCFLNLHCLCISHTGIKSTGLASLSNLTNLTVLDLSESEE